MKLLRPIPSEPLVLPEHPTIISNDCLRQIEILKGCIKHTPKQCEPVLTDIINCYGKITVIKGYEHCKIEDLI